MLAVCFLDSFLNKFTVRVHFLPLTLLLCLYLLSARGQHYDYKAHQYGLEDGLAGRLVHSLCKDKQGLLWIGTNDGLHCFDGYTFEVYQVADGSILHKAVEDILVDTQGMLWLKHETGFKEDAPVSACSIFDPYTKKSYSLRSYFGEQLPFDEERILFLAPLGRAVAIADMNGKVWQYANGSFTLLCQMPRDNDRFTSLYYDEQHQRVWSISHEHYVEAWEEGKCIYSKFIYHYWYRQIIRFRKDGAALLAAAHTDGEDFQFESPGNFDFAYFSPEKGIEPFAFEGVDSVPAFFSNKMPATYWPERGLFLSFHNRRLYIFDSLGQFVDRSPPLLDQKLYPEAGYMGRDGLIWLCSEQGLLSVAIRAKEFHNFLHDKTYGWWDDWSYAARQMLQEDNGQLIIAGHGPLFLWEDDSGPKPHPLNKKIDSIRTRLSMRHDLPILALHSEDSLLWLADTYGALFRYNRTNEEIQLYKHLVTKDIPADYNRVSQWDIHRDRSGQLWVAHNRGLSIVDESSRQLRLWPHNQQLDYAAIFSIYENDAGLWLCGKAGLFCWDGKRLQRYGKKETGRYFLPAHYFSSLYEDTSGRFWLATRGSGLICWDPKSGAYQKWTRTQGLPHNTLYEILPDRNGRLWMSSNRGVTCFHPREKRFHSFSLQDGLPTEEFNTTSATALQDGRLAFGSMQGISLFRPETLLQSAYSNIPLLLTSISRLRSSTGEWFPLAADSTEIVLNESYPALKLQFSLLDYAAVENRRYAYRILGYQDEWTYTKQPNLQLAGLPYGDFLLEIKGQGGKGQWSKSEIALQIYVPKPFYLRWYFWLFVLALLILLIGFFIRWRLYRLKKTRDTLRQEVALRTAQIEADRKKISEQAEQLLSLDKMKNRFFANISHELRTPITLVLAPLDRLLKQYQIQQAEQQLLKLAHRNGTRLLHLVEEILSLSKLEAGKLELELEPVSLLPFLRRIMANYESQALQQKLSYQLEADVPENLSVEMDAKKVEKVLNNLIANALKFTPNGESITLFARWEEREGLHLRLRDTGQGIAAKDLPHIFERFYQAKYSGQPLQGGTGIGLAFSKELVEFMQGRIEVQSQWGKGSTFSLFLPLKATHKKMEISDKRLKEEVFLLENKKEKITTEKNKKVRLLLAEDNYDMRQLLVLLLSEQYELQVMQDGLSAWEWLQAHPNEVSLVVSDWMMPKLDGSQLLEKMRADERFLQMPFILLTARAGEQDRLSGYRLGVDDYMTKPFNEEELLARVHNLLQRQAVRKKALEEETRQQGAAYQHNPSFLPHELEVVKKVEQFVYSRLDDSALSVEDIATQVALSSRQLNRILKKITGFSTNAFARELRLQKARHLLENKSVNTVAEAALEVGFETHAYFSKIYKNRFGRLPSDYLY